MRTFPRPVLETLTLLRNLSVKEGHCFAKNAWLAKARGVSEATITRHISQIVKAGLFIWRRVGKERHLFPVDFSFKICSPATQNLEKMTRQRAGNAERMPRAHAGATNQQTLETSDTCRDNKQQTASPESLPAPPAAFASVVVSSAKASLKGASPRNKQAASGSQSPAMILPTISESNKGMPLNANESQTPQTRVATTAAEVKTSEELPPPPSLVAKQAEGETWPDLGTLGAATSGADVEIITRLRQSGLHSRAAQGWAAKLPAECQRLLAVLPTISGVRDKARWLITALRDAEQGNPWEFSAPLKPKPPLKAALEGATQRRQLKQEALLEAEERAAENKWSAIPKQERDALEQQIIDALSDIMRNRFYGGSVLSRNAVRAEVIKRWQQRNISD